MKYLLDLWQRSKIIRRRLDDEITMNTTILSVLGAILGTTIVILPLILIVIPLFLFVELQIILTVLIFIIGILGVYLYEFLMYYIIGYLVPKVKYLKMRVLIQIEGTLISLVLVTFGIVVTIIIFGRL
mgnify:CR=1 FL=1